MKIKRLYWIPVIALAIATSGFSQTENQGPVYLSLSDPSLQNTILPPPVHGSDLDLKDMQTVLDIQGTRTDDECKRASYESSVSLEIFFGPKYGPLTDANVARYKKLFEQIRIDTEQFVKSEKQRWNRLRPYLEDSRVTPCIKKEGPLAYPSGHATISRVFFRILSVINSTQMGKFQMRADVIGQDRVLGGVHHPTDIEAGKILGDKIAEALLKNPDFQDDLKKVMSVNNVVPLPVSL